MKPTIFMHEDNTWSLGIVYFSSISDRFFGFQFGQLYIGVEF